MTRRKRRAARAPITPRCPDCKAPLLWLGSPFNPSGPRRPFNPTAIDGHHLMSSAAYPVMSRRAYRVADLVDVIQVQRECSREDAEDEVRDMPWHQLHACPNNEQEATRP